VPNAQGPSAPPPQCAGAFGPTAPVRNSPSPPPQCAKKSPPAAGPVRGSQRRTAQCASVPPDEGPSVQSLDRTVRQAPVCQALVRNLLPPPPQCAQWSPPAAAKYSRACGRCGPACHVPGGLPPATQYARDPRPMCRGWMPRMSSVPGAQTAVAQCAGPCKPTCLVRMPNESARCAHPPGVSNSRY
jgi:hypothetical protein